MSEEYLSDNAFEGPEPYQIRQAILEVLGSLNDVPGYSFVVEGVDGLNELILQASDVHKGYSEWYASRWPKGGGKNGDWDVGFADYIDGYSSSSISDWPENTTMPVTKSRDMMRQLSRDELLAKAKTQWATPEPDKDAILNRYLHEARWGPDWYKRPTSEERDAWAYEMAAAELKREKERRDEKLMGKIPDQGREVWDEDYPRQVGTLFLFWAFDAVAKFYELFLPERDRQFVVPKRNPKREKFSEAAKVAFTLAQGFEKGYGPGHCYYIARLWNLPEVIRQKKEVGQEVPKTYADELRKRQNLQDRCEFFTRALY
ncbi:MAG: hypothetical protein AAFR98_06325 [Pseudomonadota bacterium]